MKPWVSLLALYILTLSLIPCTWECSGMESSTCCLHCKPAEYDHSSHNFPLSDCTSCNPLSCCNSISFQEYTTLPFFDIPLAPLVNQDVYIERFNEAVFIPIWQPPKIA